MPRIVSLFYAGSIFLLFGSTLWIAVGRFGSRANTRAKRAVLSQLSHSPGQSSATHRVIVRKPTGPPRIELVGADPQGRVGSVACSTCHGNRLPDRAQRSAARLDEFHRGMNFSHGNIACYACHNPDNLDTLRLADGSPVTYQDVMTLCSQCHSQQADSFAHGAHGGMNGHWDLSRGPQLKNNCIDCHDPHAPRYPKMVVGFKPRDRFNEPSHAEGIQHGALIHEH